MTLIDTVKTPLPAQKFIMHLQSVPPTPTTTAPPMNFLSNPPSAASLSSFPIRWGELPAIEDDPGIAALERETVTKLRPMTVEPAKPFQPTSFQGCASSVKQVS